MSRSRRIAREAWRDLTANRQRTLLMAAGVVIGVAVLAVVVVAAQGARARIMDLVAKHGMDMLMVRAGGDVQVFAPQADRGLASLTEDDARAIATSIPDVRMVSVVQNQRGLEVVFQDRAVTTRAFGVGPDWAQIRRWSITDGEFIGEDDMAGMNRVALLGARVARELFPDGGAVGQVIRVNNDPYTVKGVFIEMGASAGGDDWDDRIVVPATTSARRLFGRPYLEQIVMQVGNPRRVAETAEEVRLLLRERHRIAPGAPDDFFVREPEDVQEAALATSATLTALLIAIAAIALLAGGLVITNVMLLAVSQRTHEIGLRRALGARADDIRRQFLLDAVFVTLLGGAIGAALGIVAAQVLAASGMLDARITWLPFVIALGAAAAIGILAGLGPARRAAAVQPAVALRERPM
jgi:putative ABC transport system permease protein